MAIAQKHAPVFVTFVLVILACAAYGQGFPHKPIRLVVAQAPGSSTDMLGRLLARSISETIGQQVFVDNRPGAGGTLGTEMVAKAVPDGHTLLLGNISTHGVNPGLYAKLPYNAVADFSPISLTGVTENVLVTHPSLPVRSVKELIALARKKPGSINFSSAGNGSAQHLAVELFKGMAGVSMIHVPYKGGNPAITAVVSGESPVMIPTLPLALPHVKSNKVKMLAVTSARRLENFPGIPTVAETLPGYEVVSWFGLLAPAGAPAEAIRKLNASILAAMSSEPVRNQLKASRLTPTTSSPEEFAAFIKTEIAKWTKVARDANIKAE